ncbi:MAG TPA: globin [Fluviicola sp.]|nr:globin [Fluviicola sp.]
MESLYDRIGKERLHLLVNRFYDLVFDSPVIGPLFQTDKELIRQKQEAFLTQFLGGPQHYTEVYGHPRMRMRHLPHRITPEAGEEWLRCMKTAIDSLEMEEALKTALYNCFPPVAKHMVNS